MAKLLRTALRRTVQLCNDVLAQMLHRPGALLDGKEQVKCRFSAEVSYDVGKTKGGLLSRRYLLNLRTVRKLTCAVLCHTGAAAAE